ncbi:MULTISPECIES: alpha/beta fold hydrolase [unclassified Rhizobacter]|uniref:alpha/beta fold hydrolase n=1 Tax=unclassified Rhizobacter TaxID=2640088 RepID=UPI0006FFF22B|nr:MULTISPECIES: alpha/beta hydrolase [unclassified Rhizobacter]KQU64446.1 alpha/beta hydrolase [Rhizobacter sp. Root29]KQW11501.1 alpha/beta hydrolase [Rhizobacter sp. Root1238]KRB19757.1 alpha/beta hydrolase [Rhizobacter sp. Root16D2]
MKLDVQGRAAFVYTGGKPLDATLPALVFVHGAMHDHSVWGLQTRYLAHHRRAVLAPDLPGHGRSDGPAPASVEACADWLLALLVAAGIERAAFVGHSMGSLIALEAAARLGEHATGLVLLGPAYPMKVSDTLLSTSLNEPLKAIDMVNSFSHAGHAAKPSAPAPGFSLHGVNRALMRRLQAQHTAAGHGNLFHQDFRVCNQYAGGLEAAARVRCASLMIVGAHDQMTPPKASATLAQALHAKVLQLPAGHSLMGEVPDAVLNAIQAFIPEEAP